MIQVISASKMCRNFGNFKKVPISIPAIEGGGGNVRCMFQYLPIIITSYKSLYLHNKYVL